MGGGRVATGLQGQTKQRREFWFVSSVALMDLGENWAAGQL